MKYKRPIDCKTVDDVCRLPRDNVDIGDFWMLTDGFQVTMAHQVVGAPATSVSMPRDTFNKLIAWYTTGVWPQRKAKEG